MTSDANITSDAHPAPERHQVSLVLLFSGLIAGPAAWSLHLMANYALASERCFPPTAAEPPWLRPVLMAIGIAAVAGAAAGALICHRLWQAVRHERSQREPKFESHAHELVEIGEGRTRFLAIWGVLIGLGFFLAIIFDFVGLWILPICG